MGAWLLKNWFPLSASATITLAVCYLLHSVAVARIEAKHENALTGQKTVLTEQCEAAKAITEEVSSELQKKLSVRDAALADARRLLNKRCAAAVVVNAPTGYDGSSSSGKHGGSDDRPLVADGHFLLDFADEAEGYRVRLNACQSFVDRSRAARLNQ